VCVCVCVCVRVSVLCSLVCVSLSAWPGMCVYVCFITAPTSAARFHLAVWLGMCVYVYVYLAWCVCVCLSSLECMCVCVCVCAVFLGMRASVCLADYVCVCVFEHSADECCHFSRCCLAWHVYVSACVLSGLVHVRLSG